jgi:hypothetical protein
MWESQIKDGFGIAGIAVQNGTGAAQFACPDAHQFSPESVSWRGAGVHVDLVLAKIVESLQHQAEWLVHQLVCCAGNLLLENVD